MIYTITTNPSLDYYMIFDEVLTPGFHHRTINEYYVAGGKGVNVSIFLNELSIGSSALGFTGGFTEEYFLNELKKYQNIQPLFISVKDNTRINVRTESLLETALDAKGPHVTDDEFERFKARLNKFYDSDIVCLSGSIQDELKDKIVDVVKELSLSGVRVVLDTTYDVVDKCLAFKPYLIKINDRTSSFNENEILLKAAYYIEAGAKYVIYSSATSNVYYLIEKDNVYKCIRERTVDETTGSGDAMVAGFLFGSIRGANSLELFKYGVACSTSLKLSNEIIDKKIISNIFDDLEVTEIK